jgi:hypothetical protein
MPAMLLIPVVVQDLRPPQRALLVALFTPAFTVVTIGLVPALLLLPFLPGGTDRAIRLIRELATFARNLLTHS